MGTRTEHMKMKMTLKLVLVALVAYQCYALSQTDELVPEMTYDKNEPVDAFTIVAESDELVQDEEGSGDEELLLQEGSDDELVQASSEGSGDEELLLQEGPGFDLVSHNTHTMESLRNRYAHDGIATR